MRIKTKISKSLIGEISVLNDFVKYASAENIRQLFSRLEKLGVLERLAQVFI